MEQQVYWELHSSGLLCSE